MIEQIPRFSRARTLLREADVGRGPASPGAGEAEISPGHRARIDPGSEAGFAATDRGDDLGDPQRRAADDHTDDLEARLHRARAALEAQGVVDVVSVQRQPARAGSFGRWRDEMDPRLRTALGDRVGPRPYAHQAEALDAIAQGRDVVLATSTASGKSLCFQAPIIAAALASPDARALMMFPTKALARDQVEAFRALVKALPGGPTIGVGAYDGDTPPDQRRAARSRAHAVATNPDMLHRGILPHHERWASFIAGLRYIVLDELHTYRGLFGSHVANVLRRLWRVCRHYGARPQVIACSATIGNPGELAERLCPWIRTGPGPADGIHVIDHDTAPTGQRTFMIANPRVVDATTGVRRDYLKVTRVVASGLMRHGVTTLVFCRTRKNVELLTRYLRDDEANAEGSARDAAGRLRPSGGSRVVANSAVRGYRGGYLPDRRRDIERALRDGEATMVATTNALELGMDIGGVDAVVLSGYPGTRAATLQRAGRAGRRGRASLTVCVLSSTPLDQFVANEPAFLFGRTPEHARIDADNPEVLLPHLHCAAHELPMGVPSGPDAGLAGLSASDTAMGLAYLADNGSLHAEAAADGGLQYHATGPSPAQGIDLRGSIEENFTVVDPKGDILAEVDFEDAPLYLHPGAIYAIEGRPHEVRALDWDGRKAAVRAVDADYYTEAVSKSRVRIVDPSGLAAEPEAATNGPRVGSGTGYAHLVRTVPGFKKIRLGTHENIGFGPITLPDLELHTTAAFWGLPDDAAARLASPGARASATLAAAHAMHHVAAMMLMCDVGDLGHAVTPGHPGAWGVALAPGRRPDPQAQIDASAVPHVILYDRTPGGAGLSTHAYALGAAFFARVLAVVAGCGCAAGCPTCMGPMAEIAMPSGGLTHAVASDPGLRRGDVLDVLRALATHAPEVRG